MADIKKLKDMVAAVLERYPAARNNDRLLVCFVYERFFGVRTHDSFFDVMNSSNLPSHESITRCRRKLQEEMPLVYGASGKVRKIRREEEELYRETFRR